MEEQGKRLAKRGRSERGTKVNEVTENGGKGMEKLHRREIGVNIYPLFIY